MSSEAGRSERRSGGRKAAAVGDLLELILAYARQETLGPLRGLGRWLTFGAAGAVAISTGSALLLLALLRALQTETGTTFSGNLSWLPYVITAGMSLVIVVVSVSRITRGPATRRAVPAGEPSKERAT